MGSVAQQVLASGHSSYLSWQRDSSQCSRPQLLRHMQTSAKMTSTVGWRICGLRAQCLQPVFVMRAEGPGIRKQCRIEIVGLRKVCAVSFLLSRIDCSNGIPRPTLLVFPEFVVKKCRYAHALGLHSDVVEACRGFQCLQTYPAGLSVEHVQVASFAGRVAGALCTRHVPGFRQLECCKGGCVSM